MKYFKQEDEFKLESYAKENSTTIPKYLDELERISHLNTNSGRMVSGWEQGRILSTISKMIRPKSILEIGTFTGYSALCLAEGLQNGGQLISLDINPEWNKIAKKYINQSPYHDSIKLIIQDALEYLLKDKSHYDLIFIDADKERYSQYFEICLDLLNSGGFLLADNVLWSGKVLHENPDKTTASIIEFNRMVCQNTRVENFILPIRDGINIIRKLQ